MPKSEDKEVPQPPFELQKYHKAALLKLFRCYHGGTELTYPELSREIGVGEKTKAWQCVAWKGTSLAYLGCCSPILTLPSQKTPHTVLFRSQVERVHCQRKRKREVEGFG